jgi:glycine/D-amino acid oxidase-like deaminating enzyme
MIEIAKPMNRRLALRNGALLAAGAFHGCSTKTAPEAPVAPKLRLPRVNVSPERVIRTIAGLRPFRSSGFRVEKENLDGKVLVHNYGHGGGGITLSWGTSHLAVEELYHDSAPPLKAAVLGSGALGLATARLLQRRGVEVTIYARDLPPSTTSNVAAGQWSPYFVSDFSKRSERFKAQFEPAARLANRYFQEMVGDYYGVRWLTNYVLSDHPFGGGGGGEGNIDDLFPESKDLAPGEHPFPVKYVRQFTTMMIEPPVYLNAVTRDFQLAGGRTVVREFKTISDVLSLSERAIVNCTGLGAQALFDDQELVPVKGQLTFVLPQPEVDYVALFGDLYMMPRRDGILLGGTHERGNWNAEPDAEARERILEGHQKLFASMRG